MLATQAGSYILIVTNVAGSATSTPAALRILVTPALSGISITGSTVSITVPSTPGLVYMLEYKDLLTDTSWTPLPPPATGTGGILLLQDTNATAPNRFYRVRTE